MISPSLGARAFIPVALAGVVLLGLAPSTPVAAAAPQTEAQKIIQIATTRLGDAWRFGASGPSTFDCTGLVIYAFRAAGDGAVIANGRYRSAVDLYHWFRSRGLASRSNPMVGDLVVWGGGSHVGIYIGGGKAISTLTRGVSIHGVFAVTAPFTAYLHTGMSGSAAVATVAAAVAKVAPRVTAATAVRTRVTRTAVNLRTGASIGSARIAVLPGDRLLTVVATGRDSAGRTWLQIRFGSRTGWVASWLTR